MVLDRYIEILLTINITLMLRKNETFTKTVARATGVVCHNWYLSETDFQQLWNLPVSVYIQPREIR